jgi:hypothetical protein
MSVGESQSVRIKRMDTPAEELAVLKQVLDSNNITPMVKDRLVKKVVGSWCVICGGIPTQIASYDVGGAKKFERYCDACVEKTFSRKSND